MATTAQQVSKMEALRMRLVELFWVAVIYLSSELAIWGLSCALSPANMEYFSSLFGMLIVFAVVTIAYLGCRRCDAFYHTHIKWKVDFINANLGIAFPIPMVMLDQNEQLYGAEIGRVIAAFLVTNICSWTACFVVPLCAMKLITRTRSRAANIMPTPSEPSVTPPRPATRRLHWHRVADARDNEDREKGTQTDETPSLTQDVSFDCMPLPISPLAAHRTFMATYFPLLLSVIFGLVVGVPVLASTGDGRVLDGCVIWLFWLLTIRIQQIFRKCSLLGSLQRIKNAITTLLNPVLLTTSLLLAYTRIKNAASPGLDLTETLGRFSKGTPIYALWTSSVLGTALPDNPTRWFGAGDAALSILEVGILIWGFKLYECRRQLFSQAGVITILTSVAASAANVFLSVLIAHAVGLEEHEALAFAARSTTLALARPSIKAVHGNVAVNAALVVSNGVVGQLMYPLMPRALGLRGDPKPKPLPSSNDSRALIASPRLSSGPAAENQSTQSQHEGRRDDRRDNPVTIATGVAVGINGAAMGVAYLYLQKSRAAPYAAVAMTAFGMMTVVFTTIEPFRGTVLYLASS